MTRVRLLADDLTGALDSGSAFAPGRGGFPVHWHGGTPPSDGSFGLDTETRDLDGDAAAARVAGHARTLAEADVGFKKIDSLLRGNTTAEIAACLAAGGFASAVIAPAFPAQHRIMRNGRQRYRPGPDRAWRDSPVDLAADLRRRGLAPAIAGRPRDLRDGGVFLCDAASDAELDDIVRYGTALTGPCLWCGSAGLAGALAGPTVAAAAPAAPLLVIVGSTAAATRRQVDTLERKAPGTVLRQGVGDEAAVVDAIAGRLERGEHGGLAVDYPLDWDGRRADAALRRTMAALVETGATPGGLFVTGGRTLRLLCGVLAASTLDVLGEVSPGVPLSRLHGGRWDGRLVLSKSGGFGAPDFLAKLLGRAEGPVRGA